MLHSVEVFCNVYVAMWQQQYAYCLCSVLQYVAVCCSVSQYVCCNVATAVCALPLHCVAVCCVVLQFVAMCRNVYVAMWQQQYARCLCSVLQYIALCRNVSQCVAICMLQCGNSSMRIAFHACVCGLRFCAYIRVYDCFYYCVRVCMCAEMQVGKSSSFSALLGKSETLKKEAGVVSDTVAALKVHLSFYVHAYIYVHV